MTSTSVQNQEIRFQAEDVLDDCNHAITKHTLDLQGEDFRLSWWTIVSLLRAVGHVLAKVDAANPKYKYAIQEEFEHLKKDKAANPIFWEFIESHRNLFLKEYKYIVSRRLTLPSLDPAYKNSHFAVSLDNLKDGRIRSLHGNQKIESFIASGHYEGKNEKEVALMAVSWWGFYIDLLKRRINNHLDKDALLP